MSLYLYSRHFYRAPSGVKQGSATATHGWAVTASGDNGVTEYTDNFNRSDRALDGDWVYTAGSFAIVGNKLQRVPGGNDFAVNTNDLGSPDHFVEATVFNTGVQYCVVHVRTSTANRGTSCYMGFLVPGGGYMIGKQQGGGYADVLGAGGSHSASHKIRLEVEGTALRFYVDDVLKVSTTDTSITTGNQAGINSNSGGPYDAYDDWKAGPLGAGPPPVKQGSAIAVHDWAQTASGKKVPKGSATATYDETSAAAGKRTPNGTASATYTEVAVAAGKFVPKASASVTDIWAVSAVGSSHFDPTALTGLVVWLDASDVGAITTEWPDKSGGNHHGTIVGTPVPTVQSNALNGLSVVRFKVNEGRVRGNNGLVAGLPTFNFTLVYVARMVGPSIGRIFAGSYPSVNFLVGYHTSAYDSMYDNAWVNPGVAWPALPTPWKMHGADASHDGSNYLSRFFINGVVSGTNTGGTGLAQGYNLSGYDLIGTQETCDCEVAELVIYDRKLSEVERVQVEDYLWTKWLPTPPVKQGSALTSWAAIFTPSPVGYRTPKGASIGVYAETLLAAGKKTPKSAPTTTYAEAVTAVGKRTPKATAVTQYTEAPSSVGKRVAKSTVTTTYLEAVAAAGVKPVVEMKFGSATTTWAEAAAASGKRSPKATATAAHTWVPSAIGVKPVVSANQGFAVASWVMSMQGGAPIILSPTTGLGVWLEADKITGFSDGAAVSTWSDASGLGRNAVARPAAPLWRAAGMNGRPTVEFTNSPSKVMQVQGWGTALNGKTDYSMFLVFSQDEFGSFPVLLSAPYNTTWRWLIEFSPSPAGGIYWGQPANQYNLYDTQIAPATPTMITCTVDTAGAPKLYKNGVEITSFTPANGGLLAPVQWIDTDVLLGGYYNDTLGISGQVAVVLWYDRVLTSPERGQVEDYLNTKYFVADGGGTGGWAIGKRIPEAAASITYTETVSAAGVKQMRGAATTAYLLTPSATGKRVPKAAATTTYLDTLAGAGKRIPKAAAATTFIWSAPTGVGKRVPKGSQTISVTWALSAAGKRVPRAAAITDHLWESISAGEFMPVAIADTVCDWVTEAAGKYDANGFGINLVWWEPSAEGVTTFLYFEGLWNGQEVTAAMWGEDEVIGFLLTPP